jgi:protein O-mannosyl-transferase
MAKKQVRPTHAAVGKAPSTPKKTASAPADYGNWQVWIPVAVAALVFAVALTNGMTGVDDHASTTDNKIVTEFSVEQLLKGFNLGMYAPVTWIGYALAYAIGKDAPFWYHLLSWLVHMLNTWLVVRLVSRLVSDRMTIFVVSLLFAVHPIQAESVAWIAGFSTPMYALFCLLSFRYYLDWRAQSEQGTGGYGVYALALLMMLIGCLAKSAAVTVPLTLIVLDWWQNPKRLTQVRSWVHYAPFFALSVIFGLLTIYSREKAGTLVGESANGYLPFERVLMVCYAPVFYLSKILLPYKLNIYYSFDKINGALPWYYWLAPVVIVALTVWAWRTRKTAPYIAMGLGFFITNLVVTLPVASLGTFELCADHYNYIACIGIFLLLAKGLEQLRAQWPQYAGQLKILAQIWVVAMPLLCIYQIRIWKDTLTVITNAIDNGYYHRGMMYMGRGVEYGDLNQPQMAMKDFTRAIELDSNMRDAYKFRGSLYAQSGQLDLALKDLERCVTRYDSADVVSWNNLAMIYMRQNRLPEALTAFNKSIALNPASPLLYQGRAKVYELMGNMEQARTDATRAQEARSREQGNQQ